MNTYEFSTNESKLIWGEKDRATPEGLGGGIASLAYELAIRMTNEPLGPGNTPDIALYLRETVEAGLNLRLTVKDRAELGGYLEAVCHGTQLAEVVLTAIAIAEEILAGKEDHAWIGQEILEGRKAYDWRGCGGIAGYTLTPYTGGIARDIIVTHPEWLDDEGRILGEPKEDPLTWSLPFPIACLTYDLWSEPLYVPAAWDLENMSVDDYLAYVDNTHSELLENKYGWSNDTIYRVFREAEHYGRYELTPSELVDKTRELAVTLGGFHLDTFNLPIEVRVLFYPLRHLFVEDAEIPVSLRLPLAIFMAYLHELSVF